MARNLLTALIVLLPFAMPTTVLGAAFSDVYDLALGGDMVKALALLDSLDASRWSAKDSTAADCLRRTFSSPPREERLPPISKGILTAYRRYWQTSMLRRAPVKDAEAELLATLNAILAGDSRDLDAASEEAKTAISREGLFALTGVTLPYYELMLWQVQTPTRHRVKLPERTVDVTVVFLDDFVSLGWAGYATCDRSHSGGWATRDSLYALKSAYDLASEAFRVSYLAHEGRHSSDYKVFPKLEQPELEYRAKLTEIAVSDTTTFDLAVEFARRNGRDRAVPHHFANYWVAKDLGREVFKTSALVSDESRWRNLSADRLRAAAAHLLENNSALLMRLGAEKTERFLDVSQD